MKSVLRAVIAAVMSMALAACERGESGVRLEPVASPAAAGSMAPQLFNVNGTVSLSWLDRRGDAHVLRYATWTGDGWSGAREVARGTDWFANWADLPGARPIGQGGWVAWWLQKSAPATYAYDVQLAFSADGAQWRKVGSPHSDGTPTEHGFVTAFDLPDGGLGLAWLDGRNTAGGGHAGHAAGGMTLRYAMFDAGGNLTEEAEFDDLTCDCCQTDSAATKEGIVMVYRDRTRAEIRDIYAARYVNGQWSKPVRVNADNWKIDGCPVNGPAVAAHGDRVGVAWFTAPEGKGRVLFAWSDDGGRTFGAPIRIAGGGDGSRPLGRVDLVSHPEHGMFVSWMEQGANGAEVRLRRIDANGAGPDRVLVRTDAGRAAGFPRMTVLEDGRLLLAWTEVNGAARRVRTATVTP